MGARLSKLWGPVSKMCSEKCAGNKFSLKADRGRGRLLLHVGHRVIELFHVAPSTDVKAPLEVKCKSPVLGLPPWLSNDAIQSIADDINRE